MKNRLLALLLGLALAACSLASGLPASETPIPATETPLPTATHTLVPSATPYLQAAAFGEPILAAIQGVAPHVQDDFSSDRGWYGVYNDNNTYPSWASVAGGFLQAVNDGSRVYTHLQNDSTAHVGDFVLMVDAQFRGAADRAGQRNIGLCWWPGDHYGEVFRLDETGRFESATCYSDEPCQTYLTGNVAPVALGETVSLALIHLRQESVVYVNGVPLVYHLQPFSRRSLGVSLCPLTEDGLQSDILYDNLRLWYLEYISIP